MLVAPLLGQCTQLVLGEFGHLLQGNDIRLLPLDPLRAEVGGLLVIEAVEDVVGENLEGFAFGRLESGSGKEEQAGHKSEKGGRSTHEIGQLVCGRSDLPATWNCRGG